MLRLRAEGLPLPDYTMRINRLLFGGEAHLGALEQQFPGRNFMMRGKEFKLAPGGVALLYINLVAVRHHSFFYSKPSFMQTYSTYEFGGGENMLSGGVFVVLKLGEYEMTLSSESESFSEFVTWLLATLSGIFYLSYMFDYLCRTSGAGVAYEEVSQA